MAEFGDKHEDDIEFEDSENYRGAGEGLKIQQIVLKQLQKCCEEGGKEMDGGGIKRRLINGVVMEIAAPNQREIFINNIEMLRILVLPEIEKHKAKIKKHLDEFDKAMKEIEVKYNQNVNSVPTYSNKDPNYRKNPDEYRSYRNSLIGQINDMFELERVRVYRNHLLTAISFLLNELNYFGEVVWHG